MEYIHWEAVVAGFVGILVVLLTRLNANKKFSDPPELKEFVLLTSTALLIFGLIKLDPRYTLLAWIIMEGHSIYMSKKKSR